MRALLSLMLVSALWSAGVQAQSPEDVGGTVEIELLNGDVLTGTLLEVNDTDLVLDHPSLGPITIPRIQVRVRVEEPEEPVEPESPWSGSITISANGASGNSINDNVRGDFTLRRETERTTDTYDATYQYAATEERDWNPAGTNYGRQGKDRSTNRFFVRGRREWTPEDTKWRPFLQGTYEQDSFAGWDRRVGVHTGAGYPLIDEDIELLIGRLGIGLTEDFHFEKTSDNGRSYTEDETTYEVLLGADYRLDVDKGEVLTFNTDIFPGLNDDPGDFRSISRFNYVVALGNNDEDEDVSPWNLTLGFEHRYDTTPGRGDASPTGLSRAKRQQRTDYNYFVGLGRTF